MDHHAQTGSTLGFTPAVGDMPLTPRQRSLLSLASELGRTKFAPRAPQWDASASFPFANYDDLRDAGLLRLCVPEAHGGLGADYPTYMMLAAEIGRHCGATALTWNMHICSTMWTGVLADGIPMSDEQRAEHTRRRTLHFDRIVKMTVANRYDPELMQRVEPTIAAARRAAKQRNFKEASALYQKAIAEGPSTLLLYGFENWRMLNEQANDPAGAKAYLKGLIDGLASDKYAMIEAATYLATDTGIQKRDLDSAQYASDKLKAIGGSKDDPDALAAMATVSAARGNFAAAAELQYDAWMGASPASKPAFKKDLDLYEGKSKGSSATAK